MTGRRVVVDAAALHRLVAAVGRHAQRSRIADPELADALAGLTVAAAPEPTPWLPVAEAARLLAVSERTVRRRCADGTLEHRREGRRLLVARRAVTPPPDSGGPARTRADTPPARAG